MFEKCFVDIGLSNESAGIIEACLQVLTEEASEYLGVLEDLYNGDSSGFEVACIYLEDDYSEDDICPEFSGVCFNYQDEYTVVNVETANKILLSSIALLDFDPDSDEKLLVLKNNGVIGS